MSRAIAVALALAPAFAGVASAQTAGSEAANALAQPAAAAAANKANPLWAIPLESLRATRERPLFSASRRPPPPPVALAEPVAAPPPAPPPGPPETPDMTLVGVVHGGKENIDLFVDRMGQAVIRLRVGQQDHGWTVRSVDLRATTLQKDSQEVRLELPARNSELAGGPAPGVRAMASTAPFPRNPMPIRRGRDDN